MKEEDFAAAIGAVLAFLIPVGIYCFLLAVINRRSKPLLVQGVWDTASIFFASSGFLFCTVPLLFHEYYIRALSDGGDEAFQDIWFRHWALSIGYYAAVVLFVVGTMYWRSDRTAIYNVDPEHFEKGLEQAASAMGLAVENSPGRTILKPAPHAAPDGAMMSAEKAFNALRSSAGYAELVVEPFPAMCHVTLHWRQVTTGLRRKIEAELNKSLAESAPAENAASGWFFSISGMVFGSVTMICVVLVLIAFLPRR